LQSRNPVLDDVNFGVWNVLKLTYEHLKLKNFFELADARREGEEQRIGKGGEGRGGEKGER
jgi:hypothetical protein